MMIPAESDPDRSVKLAYIRAVEAELAEKTVKLQFVKRKIQLAARSGRIDVSAALRNAERQADGALAAMQERLARLKSAADGPWQESRRGTDLALEDLSQSVKKLVARFL